MRYYYNWFPMLNRMGKTCVMNVIVWKCVESKAYFE